MSNIVASLNPYALAVKVAIAVAVAGGCYLYGHHVGYSDEKAVYDTFVAKQKAAADEQILANKNALATQQAKFDKDMADLKQENQNETQKISAARDAAVANRDHLASQLRQFVSSRPRSAAAGVPVAPGSGSGSQGQGDLQLSDGVSVLNQWLIDNLSRADQYAATLNYAEEVLAKDREICNGSLPGITPQK